VQWLSCACEEEKACHYSLAHNKELMMEPSDS